MENNSIRFHDVEAEIAAAMRTAQAKANLAAGNGTFSRRETLLFAFRPIHESVTSVLGLIDFKLQMKASEFATKHNLVNRDAEVKRLEKQITEGKEREVSLAAYAKPKAGRLKSIGMTMLLVFISVVESVFSQAALEKLFKTTYVGSILIGLGLAALFALTAHEGVPRYLEHGNQRKRMTVIASLSVAVFLMFGILRMDGLPHDIPGLVQLLAFCAISTMSFLAACLIGIKLWEAKKTAPTADEARAAEELKTVRKQIEEAEAKLENLKKHSDELAVYNAHLAEYGAGLKQKVMGEARAVFFDFLKTAYNNREADTNVTIFDIRDYPFPLSDDTGTREVAKGGMFSTLLLILATGLVFSCNPKPTEGDIAVTVLIDRSVETPQAYPSTDDLMRFTGLDRDMWRDEVRISLSTISDVDYEPRYVHVLEGAQRWNSNLDARTDTLKRFKEAVGESLAKVLPEGSAGLDHSVVYRTVARHATELHALPHKRRYLLVWSDCLNHDTGTSFYGKSGRKLLKQPDKLEKKLMDQVPLGDLSGITICFIHRPDGNGNDAFLAASGFFADLFTGHGSTVRISATLPNP